MDLRKIPPWLTGFIWIFFLICCDALISRSDRFFYMNHLPHFDDDCALRLNRSFSPMMSYPMSPVMSYPMSSMMSYVPYMNHFPIHMNTVSDVCIRYNDVNRALAKAKRKLRYIKPPPMTFGIDLREMDRSGDLIVETTKILADWFHLSFREINEGLPTIDTSKTDIWDVCPANFKPRPCTMSRYRSLDGHCNNMKHTVWGTSNTPFVRFLPPMYSNGVDGPRVSYVDGGPLPNVRRVSASIHRDFNHPSDKRSIFLMSWGQFIDHDLTLASPVRDENDLEVTCCNFPPEQRHKNCMPIDVPSDDPFYSKHGVRCLDFLRTMAGHRPGCALGPRVHINLLTSPIDANFIYGSTDELAQKLRLGSGGLMKTWDKFNYMGLKELLPPFADNPERDCIGRPRHLFCFLAGDERVNEQIHLTVLHTLYIRDHNRIAKVLSFLNPHWDDEHVYQETRHIMAATVQHIAFNEFLPLLLGPDYLRKYNLTLQKDGYWYGYDENVHMGPANSFQSAAFRFGHTHIQGIVRMYDKNHDFVDSIELRDLLRKPFILYEPGNIDKLIGGLINTPAQVYDPFITSEVTNHLFQNPMEHFGMDLVSLNLMRGREHGVPGYNDFREWCGMSRVQTFEELEFYMSNGTAFKYSKLYKHPDDIDLWSAGVSERIMEGAMIGPTFACIIANQFSLLRKGDRYWYENPGFPSSFTPAQLQEIRKITQAKIVCENADDMPTIQKWVFQLPHPILRKKYYVFSLKNLMDSSDSDEAHTENKSKLDLKNSQSLKSSMARTGGNDKEEDDDKMGLMNRHMNLFMDKKVNKGLSTNVNGTSTAITNSESNIHGSSETHASGSGIHIKEMGIGLDINEIGLANSSIMHSDGPSEINGVITRGSQVKIKQLDTTDGSGIHICRSGTRSNENGNKDFHQKSHVYTTPKQNAGVRMKSKMMSRSVVTGNGVIQMNGSGMHIDGILNIGGSIQMSGSGMQFNGTLHIGGSGIQINEGRNRMQVNDSGITIIEGRNRTHVGNSGIQINEGRNRVQVIDSGITIIEDGNITHVGGSGIQISEGRNRMQVNDSGITIIEDGNVTHVGNSGIQINEGRNRMQVSDSGITIIEGRNRTHVGNSGIPINEGRNRVQVNDSGITIIEDGNITHVGGSGIQISEGRNRMQVNDSGITITKHGNINSKKREKRLLKLEKRVQKREKRLEERLQKRAERLEKRLQEREKCLENRFQKGGSGLQSNEDSTDESETDD